MGIDRRDFLKLVGACSVAFPLVLSQKSSEAKAAVPIDGDRPQFSGVYPHLAFYNDHNECGVGAVVPWAGRLWVITYGPHFPFGSTDKLYEIDDRLNRTIRPESVGGTHANRMIHPESGQLFIGPYAVDEDRNVRVIPPEVMPGRLTGTARHLTDPANKIYFASMEEGFYEVDVHSLEVETINLDGNAKEPADVAGALLPGYHGKGLYSGQGRLVYANNGERGPEALERPDIPSGSLSEWDGEAWEVVRRNQFTEVTGPGGITGNDNTDAPLWSYGWDHRSAIFMLLDGGTWRSFRMPKASHTYDGAHGWHTEWPRIRAISDDRLLMTMHGMFWDFPKHFSDENTAGIRPLSTYLKIIGDFCEWNGQVVCGSDDAAKAEFADSSIRSQGTMVGQSNSNLWFVDADELDDFGSALGRGGPWVDDAVEAETYSEPFFFAGFDHRMVHVRHETERPITFAFEVDADGSGTWRSAASITVPASGSAHHIFDEGLEAEWIRVKTDQASEGVTLIYQFADRNERPHEKASVFTGLARPGSSFTSGIVRPAGEDRGTLQFAAREVTSRGDVRDIGYYEAGPDMNLHRVDDAAAHDMMTTEFAPEEPPYAIDESSVIVTTDSGQRYRLPKGTPAMQQLSETVWPRSVREIVTERSLFLCQGHIYEMPRANSGGFSKIRPVATSDSVIMDLCSWRGMLVIAGLADEMPDNEHIVHSSDGKCALWFGVIDDLWKLGKPRGEGGPWKNTQVRAGEPSDPYLMTGYDRKRLLLSHTGERAVRFTAEVDLTGDGHWSPYKDFEVVPGRELTHDFPGGFNAYWVRVRSSRDVNATAQLYYS